MKMKIVQANVASIAPIQEAMMIKTVVAGAVV